ASVAQKVSSLSGEEAKLSNYVEFKCADCRASFLRGLFLARGTLSLSAGNNHLEYRLIHKERAHILEDLLTACGVPPKKVERKSVLGLYFKRGEHIEDNLNLMQANEALFSVMNERIAREIMIGERRIANCESVNISRSVESAQKHIRAIKRIESAGLLDKLGSELLETVKLRLENDTAPLSELARLHSEPISKSALNSRFARILKIAENIDKKS
ncbi:MAG: DNA-binding protein WhiA, partial [Clostridia bacterium]|nr:DNA-binding protein WhiA [Clostridia bacterium]